MYKQSAEKRIYLVKNRIFLFVIRFIDFILYAFKRNQDDIKFPENVQNILISNIGHLGDVVLTTSMLPFLKNIYPNAKIGILVGSWSREIVEDHLFIDYIHIIDHWKINRAPKILIYKVVTYLQTWIKSIRQVRKIQYDLAIDFYPFFPNTIFFLLFSNIDKRLGYASGGFGSLLTDSLEWKHEKKHITSFFFDLLKLCENNLESYACFRPYIEYAEEIRCERLVPKNYAIFHIGAGADQKKWPLHKWSELLKQVKEQGIMVLCTGKGVKEYQDIENLVSLNDHAINMCDKVSIKELICLVRNAHYVITVDSFVAHLAYGFEIPTVVIYSGINPIYLWGPPVGHIRSIFKDLSCSPCSRKNGCANMVCIKSITPIDVLHALSSVVDIRSPSSQ